VTSVPTARLVYVGHATVLLELDGVRLLTDPVLRPRVAHLRRLAPPAEALAAIDAALVSHVHYDHLDRRSLRMLGARVTIVAPRGTGRLLRGFADVREVDVGDDVRIGDVTIHATPAEHRSARFMLRSAPSLGYVISGSRRIYFAGDTDLFEGMSALAGALDLALVPVAGWGAKVGPGHLDPVRAAQAVLLLRPRIAVPIHWGTLAPIHRTASAEPPEAFRRHVAELAPDVAVTILEPGADLSF
jgi:L-ascorbate metabolism protein UlaG (beta-lactamase superfamily)